MLAVYRLLHNVGSINHTLFEIGRIHEVRRMYHTFGDRINTK